MSDTNIPVPVRDPMHSATGRLQRSWILFFEKLRKAPRPQCQRTLLLYDTAAVTDAAPRLTAYAAGTPVRVVGVLRKTIASDLTIRINLKKAGATAAPLIVCAIPAATAVSTPVAFTNFLLTTIDDGDVFTWDILGSDASTDADGVAAFTLQWQQAAEE